MARPKDAAISQAFQQKSKAAADKLRRFQAEQLSSDMDRLFSEGLHSDLTVELNFKSLCLHSCIIKARSMELYTQLFTCPGSSRETNTVSMKTNTNTNKIEGLFRSLYTDGDITNCLLEFSRILANVNDSDHEKDSKTEVEEVFSNQTISNDKYALQQDGAVQHHESPTTDLEQINQQDNIHGMASEIVNSAIRKAFLVVEQGVEMTNGELLDTGQFGEKIDDGVNSKEVGDNKSKADENSINNNESEATTIDNENRMKNGALASENDVTKINTTAEESDESVNALLEKKCQLKTVVTPCSCLGEDLLRLWLTEIDCDTCIQINDQSFPVHKCVLSSRSIYFGAMLGGSWRETDLESIHLEGMNTGTMRQTLFYLYGGVVEVDPSCSLGGLMMMSDMYTMEGLKEVVAFNLNKEYCHFFHRPCSTCIVSIPEALALTMFYNMETMREKCVKWINKNFGKVWPTKQFAHLPQEVMELCVSAAVKDLSILNVIDTMVECRRLNEKIPRLKWSESILDMTTTLMDASIEFASQKFVNIVGSKTFRNIDKEGIAFNRQPLEDIFGMVIMALSPENSCQAYVSLEKWVATFKTSEEKEAMPLYTEEFMEFVEFLYKKCKEHLCLYIQQARHTVEWTYLPKESQKEIEEEANFLCFDSPNKVLVARPQLTSMKKKVSVASQIPLKEYFDQHFGVKVIDKKSKSPSPARHTQDRKERPSKQNKPSSSQSRPSSTQSRPSSTQSRPSSTQSRPSSTQSRPSGTQSKPSGTQSRPSSKDRPSSTESRPSSTESRSKSRQVSRKADGNKTGSKKREGTDRGGVGKDKLTKEDRTTGIHSVKGSKGTEGAYSHTVSEVPLNGVSDKNIDKPDDVVQPTSANIENVPDSRIRTLSFGQETFVPRFGQRPLRASRSMDSFFDHRQGFHSIIQRPTPTLEVAFIVPQEFHEAF